MRLWELGEYRDRDTQLPPLINPDWIVGQLAMTTVSLGASRTKVWASIEIIKVSVFLGLCSTQSNIWLQYSNNGTIRPGVHQDRTKYYWHPSQWLNLSRQACTQSSGMLPVPLVKFLQIIPVFLQHIILVQLRVETFQPGHSIKYRHI